MKYNAKPFTKQVRARVARHKRVRYHNDAVLFPDDVPQVDRKRRKALRRLQKSLRSEMN